MFSIANLNASTKLGKDISKHLLIAAAVCASGSILAANLNVDNGKSSVHAVFKQMEVPVQAKFKKFQATIDYNAAKPELSTAKVDIDVSSIDLPAPEYNQEVLKKEWFNAAQFAKASFVSTSMKSLGAGKLDVSGNLSIKGKTIAVRFPLQIKTEGKALSFEGNLPIKRLQFNIGEGEWKDTSMVADEVVIQFKVVTNP
ncbi:YceI family protein [Undibacterium flavidum]|uniref:YceI family protein n=1 Tax=Undibacterium flavidum TaxID=2762297 RepID=A0ABR6Y704_9BURK|nr:YceI family protein [Undibacterium flavidum]MBC3872384.1 YceI family protein [Undibacterium flavidum]